MSHRLGSREDGDLKIRNFSNNFLCKVPTQPTQTSLRRLQDVLKRSRRLTTKQDVVTTSGKRCRIYDVLKTSDLRRLEDVQFATSGKRLIYNVFRTSDLRCLEDVQFTTSWKRLTYDVLKTSDLWHLEDVCKKTFVRQRRSDVYTMSKEMVVSYFVLSEMFRKF